MRLGIGRADVDRAQALGPQLVAGDRHRREVLQLAGLRVLDRIGHEMHLHVGRLEFGPGLQEAEQRRRGQAHEAAAGGEVLHHLRHGADAARHVVVGDAGDLQPPDDAGVDMVAEVLADRFQLVLHLDAVLLQQFRLTDARELEDLRAGDTAGRQDGLPGLRLYRLAVLFVLDADAALAVEQDSQRVGVGDDVQVGPLHRRFDVAMRDAHAPALVDRGLRLHDAFLILAVVVRVGLEAGGLGGFEQRIVERVLVGHGRDLERPVGASAVRAVAVDEVLHAGEERGDVAPAPAATAHLRPGVEVERLAAHPDQAVDRTRSTQDLAARHRDHTVRGIWLRFGLVEPVGGGVVDQQAEGKWHAGVGVARRARFQQEYLVGGYLGQPSRQCAARRTRANDDVVVLGHFPGSLLIVVMQP